MPRYSETVLEHCRDPRNGGRLDEADVVGRASRNDRAPRVKLFLKIVDNRVDSIRFLADGCGVAIAACSMLTELCISQPIDRIRQLDSAELIRELDGLPQDKHFCAELAIEALRDALDQNWQRGR